MSAQEQILSYAGEYSRLIAALDEVNDSTSALQQHEVYMADLDKEISRTEASVKQLDQQLKSERKEHKKYRDSTLRRFAYKVGGKKEKFQSQAEEEERRYMEALNEELQAKARLTLLRTQWEDAQTVRGSLEHTVKKKDRIQMKLDDLYNSIFDGPNPEFPEEDAKESEVKQAAVVFDQRQKLIKVEAQAIRILTQANGLMLQGLNYVANALDSAAYNIYGYRGTFADFTERSALTQAQVAASQVLMLVAQARRIQPDIQDIGHVGMASQNFVAAILFDSPYSNINYQTKIESAGKEMLDAAHNIQKEIRHAQRREKTAKQELIEVTSDLELSRIALYQIRQKTVARVLRIGEAQTPSSITRASDELPSYEDSAATTIPPSYELT